MPVDAQELCGEVLAVLGEAEADAVSFGRAALLACPPGCGDCCRDDRPEDSVLAALPAVMQAVEQGRAEALAAAAVERPEGPCFFYDVALQGHCTIYRQRPLVCRLFGFAGWRDKHGTAQFRPCKRMKARGAPVEPAAIPVFGDFAARLGGIYPPLGNERQAINVAFHRAAQWMLLKQQYEKL